MGKIYAGANQTANLIYAPSPQDNILINGDFKVNQIGAAEYTNTTGSTRFVDCWYMYQHPENAAVTKKATVASDGVIFSGAPMAISQIVDPLIYHGLVGQEVTMLVVCDGVKYVGHGTIPTSVSTYTIFMNNPYPNKVTLYGRCENGYIVFWATVDSVPAKISYMGVFIGNIKSPQIWVEDPALAMVRCQARMVEIYTNIGGNVVASGLASGATGAYVVVHTPTTLRATPTIKYSSLSDFILCGITQSGAYGNDRVPTGISFVSYGSSSVEIYVTVDAGNPLVIGYTYLLWINDYTAYKAYLAFDANI
jgi:hypothetical protein